MELHIPGIHMTDLLEKVTCIEKQNAWTQEHQVLGQETSRILDAFSMCSCFFTTSAFSDASARFLVWARYIREYTCHQANMGLPCKASPRKAIKSQWKKSIARSQAEDTGKAWHGKRKASKASQPKSKSQKASQKQKPKAKAKKTRQVWPTREGAMKPLRRQIRYSKA